MNVAAAPTYIVNIYIAGDLADAKRICQQHVFNTPLCVTVEAVDFVYTGGREAGVRVGLINYPRFPAADADIWQKAEALATELLEGLSQWSLSIVGA